jgi:plasmid stabilization system protein ParE
LTYTVVWKPTAERKLADLWLKAIDRKAVAHAADMIDALLRSNPLQLGESRDEGVRILTISPISVYYEVNGGDRTVLVWAVWQSDKRQRES